MHNIHSLTILPKQHTINLIADISGDFSKPQINLQDLLIKLKKSIIDSQFMQGYSDAVWMAKRGADFLANPKLFAYAPLTYICVFLGELFNNFEIKEIQERIPKEVIHYALIRLNDFKIH